MASNKVSSKTKGRDDRGKGSKGQPSEESDDFDFAHLRKPIKTSVTGFAQARKIFDFATEELKDLLSNECDLLYECKVCRNIFRSLVNFVSHKRIYCKEKFSTSTHAHFVKNFSLGNELQRLKRMEEGYQETIKEKTEHDKLDKEDDERIPLTKDLSAIVERITKIKGVPERCNDVEQVDLQKIPNSSVAMFQSINTGEDVLKDNMRLQVRELDNMLAQDKAVLDADGGFMVESSRGSEDSQDPEGVIQISDDDDVDGDELKCKICNLQFSTQKTLKFHVKYKHLESRLVYPCPDCVDIFSTSWSVFRHLFKVHRKTAAQIRRLRESIQAKAFRMNNPPAFYERRKNNSKPAVDKKISEEERLDQENQAWMDNMESDGSAPRCGGCGRSFERRAALVAHTQTCQPRHRALAPPRRQTAAETVLPRRTTADPRRIEIQIRKDYNKGPAKSVDGNGNCPNPSIRHIRQLDKSSSQQLLAPRRQLVEIQIRYDYDKPGNGFDRGGNKLPQDENAQSSFGNEKEPEKKVLEEATMFVVDNEASNDKENVDSDSPEKSNDSVASSSTETVPAVSKLVLEKPEPQLPVLTKSKSLLQQAEPTAPQPVVSKPYVEQAEKISSNLNALKQKVYSSTDVDVTKLTCKKCDTKHRNVQELCDHMATHFKWQRYACKLCNHKNYNFDNLSEHVKTVHKLKGDSDFYHSTVKAIDGPEALELYEASNKVIEEQNDGSESPRRPSRCSSDSSRLSDDSNSSFARVETVGRKRRIRGLKGSAKRKKDAVDKESTESQKDSEVTIDKVIHHVIFGDNDNSTSNGKPFEENSSDLDDLDEKIAKRTAIDENLPKFVSRRPVRKRTRPKYEDFEYDLSNLLKMEAQGYRESQGVVATKTMQAKKKPTPETPPPQPQPALTYDINKDFVCALLTMSKKSVERSAAHMRPTNMNVFKSYLEPRASQYPFAKPMLPKNQSKADKASPKKDVTEEKEGPQKATNSSEASTSPKKATASSSEANTPKESQEPKAERPTEPRIIEKLVKITGDRRPSKDKSEKPQGQDFIPAMMPVKFRRQSLDVMTPLINKKITDLSKAGMKTKILVIKPINRKDGVNALNTPMKFQTIKLKDPLKAKESKAEQVKVVKVPKVECAPSTNTDDSLEQSTENSAERIETNNAEHMETSNAENIVTNNAEHIETMNENHVEMSENVDESVKDNTEESMEEKEVTETKDSASDKSDIA